MSDIRLPLSLDLILTINVEIKQGNLPSSKSTIHRIDVPVNVPLESIKIKEESLNCSSPTENSEPETIHCDNCPDCGRGKCQIAHRRRRRSDGSIPSYLYHCKTKVKRLDLSPPKALPTKLHKPCWSPTNVTPPKPKKIPLDVHVKDWTSSKHVPHEELDRRLETIEYVECSNPGCLGLQRFVKNAGFMHIDYPNLEFCKKRCYLEWLETKNKEN